MKSILKLSCSILLIITFSSVVFPQQTERTARNYYNLGIKELQNRKYDFAIEYLTIAIGVKPDFTEAYLARSRAAQYKGDFKIAFSDTHKIIKIDPKFGEAYFRRGKIRGFLLLEKLRSAEEISAEEIVRNTALSLRDYDSAINAGYKSAEVYLARAEHKCELMRMCGEALADYDAALDLNAGDSVILQKRTAARYRSGDITGATADYLTIVNKVSLKPPGTTTAAALNDNPAIASDISEEIARVFTKKVGQLTSEGKNVEALAEMTKAVELFPENPLLYIARAELVLHTENADMIEQDASKMIRFKPFDFEMQKRAAIFLSGSGKCRKALDIVNGSVLENPQNAEAYVLRANIKGCLEDFEGALEDNDKAVSLEPENEKLRANRAFILNRRNKPEQSPETFTEAVNAMELKLRVSQNPDEKAQIKRDLAYSYIARSRVYARQNNIAQAFSDLDRAVEILPESYTYETRAKAYKWQKMYEKSIEDFTAALKLQPKDTAFYFERGEVYFLMEKYDLALKDFEKAADYKGEPFNTIITKRIEETRAKIGQ